MEFSSLTNYYASALVWTQAWAQVSQLLEGGGNFCVSTRINSHLGTCFKDYYFFKLMSNWCIWFRSIPCPIWPTWLLIVIVGFMGLRNIPIFMGLWNIILIFVTSNEVQNFTPLECCRYISVYTMNWLMFRPRRDNDISLWILKSISVIFIFLEKIGINLFANEIFVYFLQG